LSEKRYSNPIANRVRRKRQRLPTCLLIENASGPTDLPGNFCAEAFPIKASDNSETTRQVVKNSVAVEKLSPLKMLEKSLRKDALQATFSVF